MNRYFFHLDQSGTTTPDLEGMEWAGDAAAIAYGMRTVLEILADDVRQGRVDLGWTMRIEDHLGRQIRAFDFAEIFGDVQFSRQQDPRLRR